MKTKSFLFGFALLASHLMAEDYRIFTLLPPCDTPLAVEPAIPSDFVAMSKNGTLDLNDWVYWGPKKVLEAYFKDPASLSRSLLRVRKSETVKQISPQSFSAENEELCKLMAPLGLKRLFDVHMQWGRYPVYGITAEFDKKWLYTAWVGLSDPQGSTLMFELVYPGTKPSAEDFKLWDQFLDRTASLPESFIKEQFNVAYEPGKTEIVLHGKKFSVLGEQRFSDNLVKIFVDMQKSGLKATLDQVVLAHVVDGPGAKVYLELSNQNKQMIPVVIKPVAAFSRTTGDLVYEQELPCPIKDYIK